MDKYKRLLDDLEKDFSINVDKFDEKIAKIILEIDNMEKDTVLGIFDDKKWEELYKIAQKSLPLKVAMCKTIQCPYKYTKELIKTMPLFAQLFVFTSNNFNYNLISDIFETIDKKMGTDFLYRSLRGIESYITEYAWIGMCVELNVEMMEAINFIQFKNANFTDKKMSEFIDAIIKNEDSFFFKNEHPDSFLKAIVENKTVLSNNRDNVFDMFLYDGENIKNPTPYIKDKIFDLCMETILSEETDGYNKAKAKAILGKLIKEQPLMPEEEMICFTILKNKQPYQDILKEIAIHTQNRSTIEYILKNANNELLNGLVLNQHLKKKDIDELFKLLKDRRDIIGMKYLLLYKTMSTELLHETCEAFLDKNDKDMLKAMMMMKNISDETSKSVLAASAGDTETFVELLYIRQVKSYIKNYLKESKYYPMMLALITEFPEMNNDTTKNANNITKDDVVDIIQSEYKHIDASQMFLTYEEYDAISSTLKQANEDFPEKKEHEKFIQYIDSIYKKSNIISYYPKIFVERTKENADEYDLKGLKINVEEIYKLKETEMEEFINKIKEENNEQLLNQIMFDLKNHIYKSNINTEFLDKEYIYTYKFADLYNACWEQIEKIRKQRIETICPIQTDNICEER